MSDQKNFPGALFDVRNRPMIRRAFGVSPTLWAVLLAALLVRIAAAWHWRDDLQRDRDAYRAIANNLVNGLGFSLDGQHPTAYRPPLYPLLLVATGGKPFATATLQILLGVGTVLLTWLLGRRLLGEQPALMAAGVVAVDPLLLRYTPQLMTETLFTCLVTGLMLLSVRHTGNRNPTGEPGASATGDGDPKASACGDKTTMRASSAAALGILFGLCALCRPTIWAWGTLAAVVWLVSLLRDAQDRRRRILSAGALLAAVLVTMSPWMLRAVMVFGRPIVTTTHGGYTLLLGNNPVFYDEVARQPWGTVWKGQSLIRWQQSLEERMQNAEPPPQTEPRRDRWMFRRALQNIADDPSGFLAACWLRLRRFWNVLPLRASGGGFPAGAKWAVGVFYALLMLGALVGLVRLQRMEWAHWWPLVLLMASFTAVHLVYWSNTRMRAPLIPVVALLAVRGICRCENPRGT